MIRAKVRMAALSMISPKWLVVLNAVRAWVIVASGPLVMNAHF